MTLRTLTLALLLSIGLTAADAGAELIPVEESHELDAALVVLPSTTSGYLLLRACSQCQVVSLQVDNGTQYILAGESVTLTEFNDEAVMQGIIYVFYDAQTQIVTRVRLPNGS